MRLTTLTKNKIFQNHLVRKRNVDIAWKHLRANTTSIATSEFTRANSLGSLAIPAAECSPGNRTFCSMNELTRRSDLFRAHSAICALPRKPLWWATWRECTIKRPNPTRPCWNAPYVTKRFGKRVTLLFTSAYTPMSAHICANFAVNGSEQLTQLRNIWLTCTIMVRTRSNAKCVVKASSGGTN